MISLASCCQREHSDALRGRRWPVSVSHTIYSSTTTTLSSSWHCSAKEISHLRISHTLSPVLFFCSLSLSLSLSRHPFCNQEQEEPERLREETRNRKNILLSYKQQQNKSFRDTIQGSTRRDTYYNLSQANTIAELLFGIHTLIPPPDWDTPVCFLQDAKKGFE
jgi:hypothetical protein